eukprot:GEMP01004679.1.p1 GENE.GEMP01004679.1~~GEMP01004679.1.p1  ORF type:complete len:1107 (+),score=245.98 GEMP01004679.1:199-3519(+)
MVKKAKKKAAPGRVSVPQNSEAVPRSPSPSPSPRDDGVFRIAERVPNITTDGRAGGRSSLQRPSATAAGETGYVQTRIAPEQVQQLEKRQRLNQVQKKLNLGDMRLITRDWIFSALLTGMTSNMREPATCFFSFLICRTNSRKKTKGVDFQDVQFVYSDAHAINPGEQLEFAAARAVWNKEWQGSYSDLPTTEFRVDLWRHNKNGFNDLVGSGAATLDAIARNNPFVEIEIAKNEKTAALRAATAAAKVRLHIELLELYEFTVIVNGCYFQPPAWAVKDTTMKSLRIQFPQKKHAANKSYFSERGSMGPRYFWHNVCVFKYRGTIAQFRTEAMRIAILGGEAGNSIAGGFMSMQTLYENPVMEISMKAGTDNISKYVYGKLVGQVEIRKVSCRLLKGDDAERKMDRDIPYFTRPTQPGDMALVFNLDPNEMYLVIQVTKAEGLAAADMVSGISNPCCQVKYDGEVMRTATVQQTLSPLWNHRFFIPVRFIDKNMLHNKAFRTTILPLEMESKGFIRVEVWHRYLDTLAEFLGGYDFDVSKIFKEGKPAERSIMNVKQQGEAKRNDIDDDVDIGNGAVIHRNLTKKFTTLVYTGRNEVLKNSWHKGSQNPVINFECYFVPPFADGFAMKKQEAAANVNQMEVFAASTSKWDTAIAKFTHGYEVWFPDSPKGRTFPVSGRVRASSGDAVPLPTLIHAMNLPKEWINCPQELLKFIACLDFSTSPKQAHRGRMTEWRVCKGTVNNGQVEHAWVMTRETGGMITFWETTQARKYHLPKRWSGPYDAQRRRHCVDRTLKKQQTWYTNWETEFLADESLGDADRRTRAKTRSKSFQRLPISPEMRLVQRDTAVQIPYDSIEIIFNQVQVWGNMMNHHPGLIFYDFEVDPVSWKPWLEAAQSQILGNQRLRAGVIVVGSPLDQAAVEDVENIIEQELRSAIQALRGKIGLNSRFADSKYLHEDLKEFLNNMEYQLALDPDWETFEDGQLINQNPVTPFNKPAYKQKCIGSWKQFWAMQQKLDQKRSWLPVQTNTRFRAIPLHFSTTKVKDIRTYVTSNKACMEIIGTSFDDANFTVACKCYPLAAALASVWCWIGVEVPLSREELGELTGADI